MVRVSLQDVSGKPLSSLFDGMRVDKRYPEFKRLIAAQRSSRCERPSRASRLLRELGLWFEPVVVYACSPSPCTCPWEPTGDPYNPCASACGAAIYDYDIKPAEDPRDGVDASALICRNGPSYECPGESVTEKCVCPPPSL
jgi:hypothetical protein